MLILFDENVDFLVILEFEMIHDLFPSGPRQIRRLWEAVVGLFLQVVQVRRSRWAPFDASSPNLGTEKQIRRVAHSELLADAERARERERNKRLSRSTFQAAALIEQVKGEPVNSRDFPRARCGVGIRYGCCRFPRGIYAV